MTPHPSVRRPIAFRVYFWSVLALGALLAGSAWAHPPQIGIALVIGVAVAMTVLELLVVRLPGGADASGAVLLALPMLLMHGPLWTSVGRLLAITVAHLFVYRRPLERVAHAAAMAFLSTYAAATVYTVMGGHVGMIAFPDALLAMSVTGLTLFLLDSLGAAAIVGLSMGPGFRRVWEYDFAGNILFHLAFIGFGLMAAVLWHGAGLAGLALAVLPGGVAWYVFQQWVESRSAFKEFGRALVKVLEEVDVYTQHHSVRVAEYSLRLARAIGLPERSVAEIEHAALLHDIGKIGPLHQYILNKPGRLTEDEESTIREHPVTSAKLVSRVRSFRRISEIVLAHHERPDGRGYPYGLGSDEVPIGARIIQVADAFDAMTNDRPYRRALALEVALEELQRGAGTQFDEDVVAALLRLHGEGRFPLLAGPKKEDLEEFLRKRWVVA